MKRGTTTIGAHEIGPAAPVFVVAEIGVNHDGSVDRAIDLVRHAKAAGADAIKLQVFRAAALVHRSAEFAAYQKDRVGAADPAEMLRQYELDDAGLRAIAAAAADAGLAVLSTPFSRDDVPRAAAVSQAIKIASPDLVNWLLLGDAMASGLPLIVSTGAATADEIDATVDWLGNVDFALLHCVSSYPVPDDEAHLGWIAELHRFGRPVGYSDHTTDVGAGGMAVLAGACLVEKHLTYDTAAVGPDHSASFAPGQFAAYVRNIRRAERWRGTPDRRVLPCEADVRRVSRQSLVARRAVRRGDVLATDALMTQRPGTGISPRYFARVVGREASRDLAAGEMLRPADFGVADVGAGDAA